MNRKSNANSLANNIFDSNINMDNMFNIMRNTRLRRNNKMKLDPQKYFEIVDDGTKKTSELLAECKALFSVWSYWNEKELDKNFPPPKEATTHYFKKKVESDNKGVSWNTFIRDQKHEVMTLREYAIAQVQYFKKTSKFLDKIGFTNFSDLLPDGCVACGYYSPYGREVMFDYDDAGDEDAIDGFREAIPLPSSLSSSNPSEPSGIYELNERVKKLEEWQKKIIKALQ